LHSPHTHRRPWCHSRCCLPQPCCFYFCSRVEVGADQQLRALALHAQAHDPSPGHAAVAGGACLPEANKAVGGWQRGETCPRSGAFLSVERGVFSSVEQGDRCAHPDGWCR
jgi:hypothetical protein